MTLSDAIASAGGLSVFGEPRRIWVTNKDGSSRKKYNYRAILMHDASDPLLESGDAVRVGSD
jgi:hypothetical protein